MVCLSRMIPEKLKSRLIENRQKSIRKKILSLDLEGLREYLYNFDISRIKIVKRHNMVKTLNHSLKNSPYYRDKLDPQLVSEINRKNSYENLHKFPFTTSAEISRDSYQFLAIPKEDINSIHFTYGTTGGKKTIFNSKLDVDVITYGYSLGFVNCNLTKTDIAQIAYSFGIWGLAGYIQRALLHVGIVSLPIGNYVNFLEHQSYIEKMGTSVLFGTPSYVYNLAKELDLSDKAKEKMKSILVGGEGLPEHRRKVIEENLGGEVFINYGLNEFGGGIGSECSKHEGYHIFTNSYVEIIDPKTGEHVEKEEYGELVLTSLTREAMPLIRYRTGDISRIIDGECDCGLKLTRIDYLKGRADDRVVIGAAEKFYPIVFDKLLDPIKEIKDYWIEIGRKNDRDSITTYVYTSKPSEKLREKILERFYSNDAIRIDITTTKTVNEPEIVFVDKLPNNNVKRRRLVDKRKHYK